MTGSDGIPSYFSQNLRELLKQVRILCFHTLGIITTKEVNGLKKILFLGLAALLTFCISSVAIISLQTPVTEVMGADPCGDGGGPPEPGSINPADGDPGGPPEPGSISSI